jgi:hypothetical protein
MLCNFNDTLVADLDLTVEGYASGGHELIEGTWSVTNLDGLECVIIIEKP